MPMTPQEFDFLAKLLKSKGPVTAGVRLVLLAGVLNAEAARAVGASPQSVHRSAKRFKQVHGEILKIFEKSLASSSRR